MTAAVWAALGGVLLGGVMAFVGNMWLAQIQNRRAAEHLETQHKHERQLAIREARRNAYTQILTWLSLVRDELRETALQVNKPWSGTDLTDPREIAHIDALTEMYGSAEFRAAVSKWGPTFQDVLRAHQAWLSLFETLPESERNDSEGLASLDHEFWAVSARMKNVLLSVQGVARREAGDLAD
jgi:hypothetical protein